MQRANPLGSDLSGYPAPPRLRGLLVTSVDSGAGKTLVAGAVARHLRRRRRWAEVLKPVATGCRRTREGLVSAEAEFLAACAESRRTLFQIAPVCYRSALPPEVAAAREGRPVDLEAIFEAYGEMAEADLAIVESPGGLFEPLGGDFWGVHLARLLGLTLVVVVQAGPDAVSHALLTAQAAQSAGLRLGEVVVNRYPVEPSRAGRTKASAPRRADSDADLIVQALRRQIGAHTGASVRAIVPDEPENSVQNATIGRDTQFAIDQVDWEGLAGRGA